MRKLIAPLFLLLLTIVVFRSWFLSGLLSTFDFPFYSHLMMKDAHFGLYAWDWHIGFDGFAIFFSPYSWVFPFIYSPQVVFGKYFGMDWSLIERIMYLYPYLALMIISPILLIRYIFPKNKFYLLSVLIFSFNTYSLLLAGGQVFLALASALAPIVLLIFMKIINNKKPTTSQIITSSSLAGLLLSIQIMMDPRISYTTMSATVLYLVFNIKYKLSRENILNSCFLILASIVIPLGIVALLQAFWIIPSVLYGGNPVEALGSAHSSVEAVRYFSFAKLENTISLLHPNWPDNIFGKTYFMRGEFLLLPILAFSSLFFISKKNQNEKRYILYFALLGLIGAFLAKGASEPFRNLYIWMFNNIPGFNLFRDSTKWYTLVAISYSILIPFSIFSIYDWLRSKIKNQKSKVQIKYQKYLPNVFLLFAVLYLIFLIHPAILGQLGGMYKATSIPDDYVKLEKFLVSDPNYFRTLWIPSIQKFGYYSNNHPEISAQVLFNTTDRKNLFMKLAETKTEKLLEEASIKYIIIPYDSEGEIFLTDRKYDEKKYKEAISQLDTISWLKKNNHFGKIIVYELPTFKDRFWSPQNHLKISYKYINPVKYQVHVVDARKGDVLVFAESYDKGWSFSSSNFKVNSSKFNGKFNSIVLPKNGNYYLDVYFEPQKWVDLGTTISLMSLGIIMLSLIYLTFKKKN